MGEKQAKFRSQDRGQAQCIFLSTASVYLFRKWSRKSWAGLAPKLGVGRCNSKQNPKPSTCSLPKSFPLS